MPAHSDSEHDGHIEVHNILSILALCWRASILFLPARHQTGQGGSTRPKMPTAVSLTPGAIAFAAFVILYTFLSMLAAMLTYLLFRVQGQQILCK